MAAAVGVSLALAGCGPAPGDPSRQVGPNPYLPPIHQYLLPPMHVAKVVGWNGATPIVPAGLKVQAFATGLANPRSLYVLPNGDVLVVETGGPPGPVSRPKELVMNLVEKMAHSRTKPGQRILLFRDTKGDGVPDQKSVFIDHLNSPFGVVLVGNDLYVANTDAVLRYPYATGQTQITDPGVKLCDLPGGPIDHHWTKSLTASPDGSELYAGVGSNSNITENGIQAEVGRASIWQIDRTTGAHREYATGLRNPNGLQFEPQTHTLWAVINERDELGPDLVAKAIAPDYALSSHVAPLGLVFYSGINLPAHYRGGAFVGEHGSWDRTVLNGYKVVYIPFVDGRPSGPPEDVVTGFLVDGDKARGRPVGLAVDGKGALLIADDTGNSVWRVSAAH